MQSSYWGYWLIVLGVAIVGLSISVQGMTTNTTQDYYSLKEITDASMLESVDYGYYRDYNEVKINKEKFMEVFMRMLVETMGANDTYEVNFYGIYEAPPKVSVEVKSNSGANFTSANYDTISRIDAIIQIQAEQVGSGNVKVSFDTNKGTKIPPQTIPDGGPVSKPTDPTRPCYKFVGWYVDSDLTQKYNFGTPVTRNLTLYAKWENNGTCTNYYTVTYESNGGSKVPSETVLEGDTATRPTNPTKKDYSFGDWYIDNSLTTVYDFNTPVTENITLYAKWGKGELYNTYCKVEKEKYNSWTYAEHKTSGLPYTYKWTIRFDKLTNAKNIKISNINYVSDYNTFYKEYMNNKRITMVDQNDDYVGYVNSASILQEHALKSNNFTKSLSSPYYKNNYWYVDVTIKVSNYNGVSKYYLDAAKNDVYFVPFTFDVEYTNLNDCVDDKASNSYKYTDCDIDKSFYK